MSTVLVGVDFHQTPVDVREALVVAAEQLHAARDLRDAHRMDELLVLSTCNRFEVVATGINTPDMSDALIAFLTDAAGLTSNAQDASWYTHQGTEAARHLFRVASGLESLVLGETQILGQVAGTYTAARAQGTIGPVLSRLFSAAVHCGKRARHETAISQHTLSVSHAAVLLAQQGLGTLANKRALVMGAGTMAALAAGALRQHGVKRIDIINRSPARAQALAQRLGIGSHDWRDWEEVAAHADILLTATSAARPVVDIAAMHRVMAARAGRPLFVVDIGVPRNVSPRVTSVPDVTLRDVDDLQAAVQVNLQRRESEIRAVEAIIDAEVNSFGRWLAGRRVVPAITSLRQHARVIADAEVARARNRLPELSEHEAAIVEEMAQRIVNKLLHEPTVALKARGQMGDHFDYVHATTKLFGLDAPNKRNRRRGTRAQD
jgi:glutamyl-tRNA reductase